MIELTTDQSNYLQANGEQPAEAHDPRTAETFVLVKLDDYKRMRAIVDSFTRSAGWDDPELDVYEKYRKKK
ncbi:MAG TPA: hypothetical protein VE988_29035 [Gemmataceae bacterium]|nr:hypothetical protein [Gemmataceae bacterium]